eukprot:CAMPEP_0181460076 /NCGR_PEP_ID=MMETSP1110-20121109/33153_1 /TAXON_ID=174948 /ORGANISM="Symbiodinium sp., Strain CCMP421" /LENGTH=238 /DNA_ID=CAMNT_0023584613 /DNA_START=148 /DNA_END=860 /DNA_ORIENTATION=-
MSSTNFQDRLLQLATASFRTSLGTAPSALPPVSSSEPRHSQSSCQLIFPGSTQRCNSSLTVAIGVFFTSKGSRFSARWGRETVHAAAATNSALAGERRRFKPIGVASQCPNIFRQKDGAKEAKRPGQGAKKAKPSERQTARTQIAQEDSIEHGKRCQYDRHANRQAKTSYASKDNFHQSHDQHHPAAAAAASLTGAWAPDLPGRNLVLIVEPSSLLYLGICLRAFCFANSARTEGSDA